MNPAIVFDRVTITYPDAPRAALTAVDLTVDEGELCLVIGPTGSGKSTLLGAVNGLVPHFTGGTLQGSVRLLGGSSRLAAGLVTGSVAQRAKGMRTAARGLGMAAGAFGYVYSEYRRK